MENQIELNYVDGIINVAILDHFTPKTKKYEKEDDITSFSVELLDQILNRKHSRLYIVEALCFREIIREASEYEWTTISALFNRDLSGYKVYLIEQEAYAPYLLVDKANNARILSDGRVAIESNGGWLTHLRNSEERILLVTPAITPEEYNFS